MALSEIYKVAIDGKKTKWLGSGMYQTISFSPDGNYVMVRTIEKPFSYLVPYRRFPSKTIIYTKDAKPVSTVLDVPLIEDLPKGFMAVRQGKRNLSWRSDQPATLIYVQALDGGNPANAVAYRDEVFQLDAPFNGVPKSILKTIHRFSGIQWGNKTTAVAYDYWWNSRNTKTYVFDPSNSSKKPTIISDRNYQDRYNDPGRFVNVKNDMGSYVLALEKGYAFLIGDGFSKEGQFPFVDKIHLKTQKRNVYINPNIITNWKTSVSTIQKRIAYWYALSPKMNTRIIITER